MEKMFKKISTIQGLTFRGILILLYFSILTSASLDDHHLRPNSEHSKKAISRKEVFVFSTTNKNYKHYDWSKITTLVECRYHDPELLAYAHSMNASVVFLVDFRPSLLYNRKDIEAWVEEQVNYAKQNGLDGINVDYEEEMNCTDTAAIQGFNYLMKLLVTRFKGSVPNSQVTIDFAWSTDNIDNRCYDYETLGRIVDFSFLMMYNLRGQVSRDLPCLAWANAAYNGTVQGLLQFMALGIPSSKLVFGVGWFGFDYECEQYNPENDECTIKLVPYRGCNCSDAAGQYQGYSVLRQLVDTVEIIEKRVMWDTMALSPYFSYKASDGKVHQVWYDNPDSLRYKYLLADYANLKGVGMWEADSLNYTGTPDMQKYVRELWDSLPKP